MQKVFGTEMYLVTFIIVITEVLMFVLTLFWYLQRTVDKNRLYYLILLSTLIIYNLTSGLLPDENYKEYISISWQNIIAYGCGFATSLYFGYYFYKVYDLHEMKRIVYQLALFLLVLPFCLLFIIPYLYHGDLESARRLHVILPIGYAITFIYYVSRSFLKKFIIGKPLAEINWINLLSVYLALVFWCSLPILVYFGDFQVPEALITNAGFLFMTVVYIRSSIINSQKEYELFTAQVEQLKEELASKQAEMSNLVIKLTQGQTTLEKLKGRFYELEPKIRSEFPNLIRIFKDGFREEDRWTVYFESFDKAHNGFYQKVKAFHPELSEKELRHISFLKSNLENDEIARMLEVSVSSLRQLRYRMKKKIKLDENIDLVEYIHSL